MGNYQYVVKILNESNYTLGTGLLLNNYVATVHHVISKGQSISIEYKDELYPCEIDYASEESDVAFLKVNIDVNNRPDFLSKVEEILPDDVSNKTQHIRGFPSDGEYYVAYPKGRELTAKIASSLNYMHAVKDYSYEGYYMTLESREKITKGFSGAPVYYDLEDNALSGFIAATVLDEDVGHITRIIPIQTYLDVGEKYRALFGVEILPREKKDIKCLTKLATRRPVSYFSGREKMIKDIKKLIVDTSEVVLISGMGGMGKTEVCKNIFYDVYKYGLYNIESVAWIDFDSNLKHSFFGQFREIRGITDEDEYFNSVLYYLSGLGDKLLLFIDNVEDNVSDEDKEALTRFANRVVFTSRFKDFYGIEPIKIDNLTEDECLNIYISILRKEKIIVNENNEKNIKEIIKLADYHTLTITFLAKIQAASPLDTEKLLSKLIKEGFDLKGLDRINFKDQNDYLIKHLSTVFKITNFNNEEIKILKLLSLFPAMNIKKEDAKEFFKQKDLENLNNLYKKGWIDRSGEGFAIHTVLASVVKYRYRIIYREVKHLVKCIATKLYFHEDNLFLRLILHEDDLLTSKIKYLTFPDYIFKNFNREKFRAVIPFLPFKSFFVSMSFIRGDLDLAILFSNAGVLYREIGNYDIALKFFLSSLEIRKLLTRGDLTTLVYRYMMSFYSKEVDYTNETLHRYIGSVYSKKGNYDEALMHYHEAFLINKEIMGEENNIFNTYIYDDIGHVYCEEGKYFDALYNYLESLCIREKLLEKENSSIAISYNNIGHVLCCMEDYKGGLEYLFKALEIFKKIRDQLSIASSYDDIGFIYLQKRDFEKALEFSFMSLEIKEKIQENIQGKENLSIAISYNIMGSAYSKKGDYDKALQYKFKALEIREKVLGNENSLTANSYSNIGGVYGDKRDYDKELEYLFKALEIRENVLEKENPEIVTLYDNIGTAYYKKGDYGKALEFCFKALEIRVKLLKERIGISSYIKLNLETAISYDSIGCIYREKGEYEKAFEYLFKALEIRESFLEETSSLTANTYRNISYVYGKKGDHSNAIKYWIKESKRYHKLYSASYNNWLTIQRLKAEIHTKQERRISFLPMIFKKNNNHMITDNTIKK